MEIDAVMEQDPFTGKTRMVHTGCAGTGHVSGTVGAVRQPNRGEYKTQGGYDRAVEAAYACAECGESVAV